MKPELYLNVSTLQKPLLHAPAWTCLHHRGLSCMHLDVSTPQGPELHLAVSTQQGPELHLDVSTATPQGPELLVWTKGAFTAPGRVFTTGV